MEKVEKYQRGKTLDESNEEVNENTFHIEDMSIDEKNDIFKRKFRFRVGNQITNIEEVK